MIYASVRQIEIFLPETILYNQALALEYPDWPADKIYEKTGIRERRIAKEDELSSDLALKAANKLLATAAISPESIDCLLLCTQSPDYFLPSTACILQERIGLPTQCMALDFNLGCSGFIYGLGLAKGLIETGQAHHVLLLTAETYSKFIHLKDKSVRTIFGDGAAATLISGMDIDKPHIGPFVYGTDGKGSVNLIVPTGGMRRAFITDAPEEVDSSGNVRTINHLFMNGPEIFNFTLKVVPQAVNDLLEKAAMKMEEIDLFVFHQANKFILEFLRKKIKVPQEKFIIVMDDTGNTVSSSIPIALNKLEQHGGIRKNAKIMLVGFGVGYSWGATIIHYGN